MYIWSSSTNGSKLDNRRLAQELAACSHCNTQELTVQQFVEQYELPRRPVIITGLTDIWPAQTEMWTEDQLLQRFGDHKFKVRRAGSGKWG